MYTPVYIAVDNDNLYIISEQNIFLQWNVIGVTQRASFFYAYTLVFEIVICRSSYSMSDFNESFTALFPPHTEKFRIVSSYNSIKFVINCLLLSEFYTLSCNIFHQNDDWRNVSTSDILKEHLIFIVSDKIHKINIRESRQPWAFFQFSFFSGK